MDDLDLMDGKDTVKRKSRNLSEKKRRDQFNTLIWELHSMVNIGGKKMDKTTVLKATINFLHNHNENQQRSNLHEISDDWKPAFISNNEFAQLMLESGTILYASESITPLMNHLSSDVENQSIFDLIHPKDVTSVEGYLNQTLSVTPGHVPDQGKSENQLSFSCRMECGPGVSNSTPTYERVECKGYFRSWSKTALTDATGVVSASSSTTLSSSPEPCYVCSVSVKASQILHEMSTLDHEKREFTSRHNTEWKFLFLDHRGPAVIGYLPYEVLGTSGYDYYHPDELDDIVKCHKQLMNMGKGQSNYYRFLTKGQEWVWLQTKYYITYHQWTSKPDFVMCTHTVISYAEVIKNRNKSKIKEETPCSTPDVKPDIEKSHKDEMATISSSDGDCGIDDAFPGTSKTLQVNTTQKYSTEIDQVQSRTISSPQCSSTQGMFDHVDLSSTDQMKERALPAVIAAQAEPTSSQTATDVNKLRADPVVNVPPPSGTKGLGSTSQSAQWQLQEQLKLKHQQLQQTIDREQQELKNIWDQLLLASQLTQSAGKDDQSTQFTTQQRSTVQIQIQPCVTTATITGPVHLPTSLVQTQQPQLQSCILPAKQPLQAPMQLQLQSLTAQQQTPLQLQSFGAQQYTQQKLQFPFSNQQRVQILPRIHQLQPHQPNQQMPNQLANPQMTGQLVNAQLAIPQVTNQQLAGSQIVNQQLGSSQLVNQQLTISQLASQQLAGTQLTSSQSNRSQLVNQEHGGQQLVNQYLANTQLIGPQLASQQLASKNIVMSKLVNAQPPGQLVPSPQLLRPQLASSQLACQKQASSQLASQQQASSQLLSQQQASSQLTGQQQASSQLAGQQLASSQQANPEYVDQQLIRPQLDVQQLASPQLVGQQLPGPQQVIGQQMTRQHKTGSQLGCPQLESRHPSSQQLPDQELADQQQADTQLADANLATQFVVQNREEGQRGLFIQDTQGQDSINSQLSLSVQPLHLTGVKASSSCDNLHLMSLPVAAPRHVQPVQSSHNPSIDDTIKDSKL